MKRVSLVLALAALSVPAAAGAAQTQSQPASPGKASASKVKIHGTVSAISSSSIIVVSATKSRTFMRGAVSLTGIRVGRHVEAEGVTRKGALRLTGIHLEDRGGLTAGAVKPSDDAPGDDRGGLTAGAVKPSDDLPGDDRGGLTAGAAKPSDDLPGDDHRGGNGLDDAPGHH
jgi:hypothetical protein